MRYLIRRAVLGTLFFFCSLLHSQADIHEQCSYQILYDQFGKPSKICIEAYRVVIPMMDGIPLYDQREEYICKQEYNVTHNGIEEQKKHSLLQVQLPIYDEPSSYKIPVSQLDSQQQSEGFYVSRREVPAYQDTVSKMSDKELGSLLVTSIIRQKWLRTISNYQDYLQFVQHKKFIEKLFKTNDLSEEAVWALWQEFQDQKIFKDNGTYKEKIEQWLKTRSEEKKARVEQELLKQIKKTKELAQQELQNRQKELYQKFIESQHKVVHDLDWVNDLVSNEIEQAREDALEQAELEGYMQYDQPYELDGITRGYLSQHNIVYTEYLHCHGTALQQQYHKEICDIVTQAAYQNLKIENRLQRQYQTPLLEHAINFAQAGQQANQKDWTSVTGVLTGIGMVCVDLCKDVYSRPLEYARAIGEGVVESAYDFGYLMLRPDKALYGLGQMLFYTLETVALIEASTEFPDYAGPKLQERQQQVYAALSGMQQEFIDADGPARVKAITKFGADFYLPAKLTHAVGYAMGGISSRARGMRSLEGVATLLDESLVTVEAAEKIREIELATEQGFTQKIAAEFMEAESTTTKAAKFSLRPLHVIIDEVKELGGVIPSRCKDLRREFKSRLKLLEQELRSDKLEQIKKIYGSKFVANKKVDVALEHICNANLKLIKSQKHDGYIFHISGGHVSGLYEKLEELGLIKIINKNKLSSGVTEYNLQNVFTGEIFSNSKTIYPSSWTKEKIAQVVWGIYEDSALIIKKTEDNKFYKSSMVDGVMIKIFWSEKGEGKQIVDFIHTAYPISK